VPEPQEGAHRDPEAAIKIVGDYLETELEALTATPIETLVEQRIQKYFNMGVVKE